MHNYEQAGISQPASHLVTSLSDLSAPEVIVGTECLSLAEFLRRCASSLEHEGLAPASSEFLHLRDTFLKAGLTRLSASTSQPSWLQLGLDIGDGARLAALYPLVRNVARELLSSSKVTDFFFMHKPPGLRLRFELAEPDAPETAEGIQMRVDAWVEAGLARSTLPAVYEPESHLFGGAVSMRSVHRLFTHDSLAWLDYHVLTLPEFEPPGPAWALSLLMLEALFSALGIGGWEHIDVWDRVRAKTGRALPDKDLVHGEFQAVAAAIRAGWLEPDKLLDQLSPGAQGIVERYRSAVRLEAEKWCRNYFWTKEAYIGPREAAAFFTIFHWNRARLPLLRQSLLTEALAAREGL
jgi:thiopeptide-type bacteriocin biosynthesis protein